MRDIEATSLPRQGEASRWPGAWQAAVIAALSALLAGYLGRPGAGAPRPDAGSAEFAGSRVAEVAPGEMAAALGTLEETPQQAAQAARDACGRRLAWVTVMRAPGQPSGRIRLRSGGYISPAFDLREAPVRIAIPYPAPYTTAHGTIATLGATTEAVVALSPPWRVLPQAGLQAREVSWTPAACPAAGG